jgi:hypothetical protein
MGYRDMAEQMEYKSEILELLMAVEEEIIFTRMLGKSW